MSHIDAKAETKGVEATEVPYGPTGKRVCYFDVASHPLIPYTPPNPDPQRHARINCNGKSCGEFNCDTCHPVEGELPPDVIEEDEAAGYASFQKYRNDGVDAKGQTVSFGHLIGCRERQLREARSRRDYDLKLMQSEVTAAHERAEKAEAELAALKATPKADALTAAEIAAASEILGIEVSEAELSNFLIHRGKLYILESVAAMAVMRGEERLMELEAAQSSPSLPLEEPERRFWFEKAKPIIDAIGEISVQEAMDAIEREILK